MKLIAPGITHVHPSSAQLLGAPIGDNQSIDIVLSKKLEDLKRFKDRLQQLEAHDALYLLQNWLSIPKLAYTLRCSPCFNNPLLLEYDGIIRSSLQSILNIEITDEAWTQATLPVNNGGIGVCLASHVALPAFLSSTISSQGLILKLLPDRFHDSSGTSDPSFKAAINEWSSRTTIPVESIPQPYFVKTVGMGCVTC